MFENVCKIISNDLAYIVCKENVLRKYLATNKENEMVDDEVVTVVVAAVVEAVELQSMFENV